MKHMFTEVKATPLAVEKLEEFLDAVLSVRYSRANKSQREVHAKAWNKVALDGEGTWINYETTILGRYTEKRGSEPNLGTMTVRVYYPPQYREDA